MTFKEQWERCSAHPGPGPYGSKCSEPATQFYQVGTGRIIGRCKKHQYRVLYQTSVLTREECIMVEVHDA